MCRILCTDLVAPTHSDKTKDVWYHNIILLLIYFAAFIYCFLPKNIRENA